jgi:hypothetical protein
LLVLLFHVTVAAIQEALLEIALLEQESDFDFFLESG